MRPPPSPHACPPQRRPSRALRMLLLRSLLCHHRRRRRRRHCYRRMQNGHATAHVADAHGETNVMEEKGRQALVQQLHLPDNIPLRAVCGLCRRLEWVLPHLGRAIGAHRSNAGTPHDIDLASPFFSSLFSAFCSFFFFFLYPSRRPSLVSHPPGHLSLVVCLFLPSPPCLSPPLISPRSWCLSVFYVFSSLVKVTQASVYILCGLAKRSRYTANLSVFSRAARVI